MRQDFVRLATEQRPLEATAPVRGHDDQIAFIGFGGLDDPFRRVFVLHMNCVTGEAHLLGQPTCGAEGSFSDRRRMLLIIFHRMLGSPLCLRRKFDS